MELNGNPYLIVVDYHSRYIEIANLENGTTSKCVINHLKSIFARHGVPEALISDNGPQYACNEFAQFATEYGFHHITSSPRHPQGNGAAERPVRTVKSLLKASQDPYAAMLAYRATPLACGYSPAELLMNRKLRTKLPLHPKNLESVLPDKQVLQEKEELSRCKQKLNFDKAHRAISLPVLEQGDEVFVPDRKESGKVVSQLSPRSYVIKTSTGAFRRNRSHMNKLPPAGQPAAEPQAVQTPPPSAQTQPSPAQTQPSPAQTQPPSPVQTKPQMQDKQSRPVQCKSPDIQQATNTGQATAAPAPVKKPTRSGRAVATPARYR
jgi:hypothetical protein